MELSNATAVRALEAASNQHPAATYGATGGSVVEPETLDDLGRQLRKLAEQLNYPNAPSHIQASSFDARAAVLLHDENWGLRPSEAAREAVWCFLACVLLPDLVRWRWGWRQETPAERFLGGERGLRNTFGRLWWRAELLYDESATEPYRFVHVLKEDEIVGLVERPRAVTSRRLAVMLAQEVVSAHIDRLAGTTARMDLFREVMKLFLRAGAFVRYETLDTGQLRLAVRSIVRQAAEALRSP